MDETLGVNLPSAVALTLDAQLIADSDIESIYEAEGQHVSAFYARQASDGRVLAPVSCTYFLCSQDEIVVLSKTGGRFGQFAELPVGFQAIGDLLQLSDGTWLVSSATSNRIVHLSGGGEHLGDWTQPDNLSGPIGMALTGDGRSVLVAQRNGGRVDRFDLAGNFVERWDALGHLSMPVQVVRLSTGNFVVSDQAGKVVSFNGEGTYLSVIISDSTVHLPMGVAELPDGQVLVSDASATGDFDAYGKILIYDPQDGSLDVWFDNPSQFTMPDPEGILVVYENP